MINVMTLRTNYRQNDSCKNHSIGLRVLIPNCLMLS